MTLTLPRRGRGRQSAASESRYQDDLAAFCAEIREIDSTLDFKVSSRGWAYIFENQGVITKNDLDACQDLINDRRKSGDLPIDICAVDESRAFDCIEDLDDETPEEKAGSLFDYVNRAHHFYCPYSFWEDQNYFVQMAVEKIDLKSLFRSVCSEFHVPIANTKGWADLNLRDDMMRRFAEWESKGKQCVLLYCGDHDPMGVTISDSLRSNMGDLADAVGWSPDNLIIDRFGLNYDFIEEQNLTWIDNLITGSGKCLSSPRHPDHNKSYVQSYLARFGVRKVEANALVVAPDAGRDLCRQAILQYIDGGGTDGYEAKLDSARGDFRKEILRLLAEGRP
jgi:hypothetical protein